MSITSILLIIGLFSISSYYAGLKKSLIIRKNKKLHSTPIYHGALLATNSSLSSIIFIIIWLIIEKNIYTGLESFRSLLYIISIIIFFIVSLITFKKIKHDFQARDNLEKLIQYFLLGCSTLAILITIGIFLSVIFESNKFYF